MSLPKPTLPPPTHVDGIECIICGRELAGLFVRVATGICAYCERVCGVDKAVGQ